MSEIDDFDEISVSARKCDSAKKSRSMMRWHQIARTKSNNRPKWKRQLSGRRVAVVPRAKDD